MSKKKLQVQGIMNELEGASLFFSHPPASPTPEPYLTAPTIPLTEVSLPKKKVIERKSKSEHEKANVHTSKSEINKPRTLASTSANMLALKQENKDIIKPGASPNDTIETIRKTVKQVGKEPLFVRITPEEKQQISSIVYAFNDMYRLEGSKTSENEVSRIALNWLLEDYQANGEHSILTRALAALNA